MKVLQFVLKNDPLKKPRVGLIIEGEVKKILDLETVDDKLPNTVIELLKQKPNFFTDVTGISLASLEQDDILLEDVILLPPVSGMDKVVCVGMNYKDHCEEQNVPVPKEPIFFSKFSSSVVGPKDSIPYPDVTQELDYEVELAVVIGKKGKNIPRDKALDYVLGYTVAHDVSARDWQLKKNGGQWLIGKTMDAFCPIGPWIVTKSDIADLYNLGIRCRVNGETKQDSNTGQLVHRVENVIELLSKFVTLLPGDIILTGTPPGVGVFAKPPFFLKRGDKVECEIDEIGCIENKII
ncbi:unnamed protein product [Orchesella dallaii]|uniref:Fumarylacetoacetase-like C-terminal domain-containing protein n=1 Tax=Orchesella dallaii TaxID=48710 RepID=A0ABP1QMV2_9HEXA